ncbi:MAG TPA: HAD family hydrolase [Solirubrobacteraceae bacterium]|nr:HAD family hydrolase [Solirubrobacteraceae bacterium]
MSDGWEWPTRSGALYFGPPGHAASEGAPAGEAPGPVPASEAPRPAPGGEPSGAGAPGRPAVFLDRDGVLIEGVPDPDSGLLESALRVEDVRLLPGVAGSMRSLAAAGYALVCASNQPAAAKGKVTLERIEAIHERVVELLAGQGARLDASYLCPHHPEGVVAELSGRCECRKPAPGMLLEGARRLGLALDAAWMVGDTDADVEAGRAAGCRTALLVYHGTAHKRSGGANADVLEPDLPAAATRLADHRRG